jgi:serine/threonine protein kinase
MTDRTIAGRYELESQLGSGGMGSVWRAHDRLLDRTVAVKLLHDDLASDTTFAQRFRREAKAAAGLAHPNIVAIHDTGETEGVPFIVMEYVEGRSLHEIIQQQGPLEIVEVVQVAHSILSALEHAHERQLIHRDIKPANILFASRTGTTKIVDFGIAKRVDDPGVTSTSSLIGTASYMSPEQLSGKTATPASDLYSVGCLLYCCVTGVPPFGGENAVTVGMHHLHDPVPPLRSRRPDVPVTLEAVVMKALEKDPGRRFGSARAMDQAMDGVESGSDQDTQFWTPDPDTERIRVLLVDDHQLITQVLGELIAHEPDMDVVGRAATAAAAKTLAHSLEPDVILMDYDLPDSDGATAAHDILLEHPHAKIVMLTGERSDDVLVAAIEAGCAGFVPKEQAVEQVIAAVRSAYAGQAPISPELLARLLPRLRRGD